MNPKNLVIIMSDQHSRKVVGCYGNSYVRTPNLDRLASSGTVFKNAYCNNPICVPSRASMITGEYASSLGYWDNAHPYGGEIEGWGHRLEQEGVPAITIGKLHFKEATDKVGFKKQRVSMNAFNGRGDIAGCIRNEQVRRSIRIKTIRSAGAGKTDYQRFDQSVADTAVKYIEEEAPLEESPFVLFVGFVCPHHPYIAPESYYKMYLENEAVPFPANYEMEKRTMHPVAEYCRRSNCLDCEFDRETVLKVVRAYYGNVTYMDHQVGRVLDALERAGLMESTRIIYTSDHGDSVGENGLFFKSNLYEGSVGIPLIISGPDVPKGNMSATPVSLLDIYPSVLECVGIVKNDSDKRKPGKSLWKTALEEDRSDRAVIAEYHAVSSNTGCFMVRKGRYKLNYYVGYDSELFDLENDFDEAKNLAVYEAYSKIVEELEIELRKTFDPEETSRLAFKEQERLVNEFGGYEAFINKPKAFEYTPVPKENLYTH